MIQQYNDYRSYLRTCLNERIKQNPQYSLRAFAKHLNLAPGFISDVLNGRKNLSTQSVIKVVDGLKLSSKDSSYFNLLVQLECARNQTARLKIIQNLESLFPKRKAQDLSVEHFRIIADWYHTAILEMANSPEFIVNSSVASKCLGISKVEAQVALDRLNRLELLELKSDKSYKKVQSSLLATSKIPHEGLRHFHKQMLHKAIESLEVQPNTEKFVGSETFAFDPESLKLVNEALEECFDKVVNIAKKSKKKNYIYHLGIQFFKITKGESK